MLIVQGIPPLGGVKQWWVGKQATLYFVAICVNISKTVGDSPKLLFMTNRKLHVRSMTLDDLELYKFEFSKNFSGFCIFRTQQQLNE